MGQQYWNLTMYTDLLPYSIQRWFISTGCNKYTCVQRLHQTHAIRNMFDSEAYSIKFITLDKCL